jgi:hypothetical protein
MVPISTPATSLAPISNTVPMGAHPITAASSFKKQPSSRGIITEKHHVVLVGDTSLNNGAFISEGEATISDQTITAMYQEFPNSDIECTAIHVQNNQTKEVSMASTKVPSDATNIILSIGGNDGKHLIATISNMTVAEIAGNQLQFKQEYEQAVDSLMAICPRVIVVLPYSPKFEGPQKVIADCFMSLWRYRAVDVPLLSLPSSHSEC